MHSFSIHLVAEINKIPREEIHDHYDDLEKKMLAQFFSFLSENDGGFWLHWNMSNINYGFEALLHRYKVLSGEDGKRIPDSKKFNLSSLILSVYGKNCVEHPRMASFMKLNNGEHRDNLTGKEEVDAFAAKEYVKLHKSTMSKVYWFQHMYYLLQRDKINVHKKNWGNRVNTFLERPIVKVLGFVAVLFSLFQAMQYGYSALELEEKTDNTVQEQTSKLSNTDSAKYIGS
tara:strand:+ start:1443 stop:2132 length:690 start_codon:yes stop_codon:yes gene_type:complete